MTKEEAKVLLDKYNRGLASSGEAALLHYWFVHEAGREGAAALSDQELQQIVAGMRKDVLAQTKPRHRYLRPWMAAAAALAAITLGTWLYYASSLSGRHSDQGQEPGLAMNDIAPGKNTATLTLADGKVINLDTNKTSVVVADSVKAMTMLTASTPRGGTYQFTLPDGTKVWLNADSKISFPSQFSDGTRKIMLEGEAYFEVAKVYTSSLRDGVKQSQRVPFIVESAGQQVEVLGTHFNINAYADEGNIKTTLLEGSVRVSSPTSQRGVVLRPNQQSVVSGPEQISVANVDISEALDWKNEGFAFNGDDFASAMRKIERWYNVEIVYDPAVVKNVEIGGFISRKNNISAVLKLIEATGQVHFTVEGRRIIVTK